MAKGDYLTKPRFGKPTDAIEEKAAGWLEANCGYEGAEVMRSLADLIKSEITKHRAEMSDELKKLVFEGLQIAEGYVRAAAFTEVSDPPHEYGTAHKQLAQVHEALSRLQRS